MTRKGHLLTKATYEDPDVVRAYIEAYSHIPALIKDMKLFAQSLHGKKIIDIGCGPGHDAYYFAKLGYDVVGIDYSHEMIRAAKSLAVVENPPVFTVADMKDLGDMFEENSFDGAWISASLFHIPEEEVPDVLRAVHTIVKAGGNVYVGLKGGSQISKIIREEKHGRVIDREFVFWKREVFRSLVEKLNFTVDRIHEEEDIRKAGAQTTWLCFYLQVKK